MEVGKLCTSLFILVIILSKKDTQGIFVDNGNPYNNGPCKTALLEISKTIDKSPLHTIAHFPLEAGDFAVIVFIGGLSSYVPSEVYSAFLQKVATHGFFVFGIDYDYPFKGKIMSLREAAHRDQQNYGQDLDKYFAVINFLQQFMVGKTIGRPLWNSTGIMSHSAGGDIALKLLLQNKFEFKATAFLEPYSSLIHNAKPYTDTIPGLMYGTELSEKGITHCNVPGYDYLQFYKLWQCPKLALEVADFGHCNILDPVAWEGCHVTRFCTTTNDTRLDQYKQFAQGAVASFFITTLQGRADTISYISDRSKSPLRLLVDQADWTC